MKSVLLDQSLVAAQGGKRSSERVLCLLLLEEEDRFGEVFCILNDSLQ